MKFVFILLQKGLVIFSWIFLILLVPGTMVGVYAEKSTPGQSLYPIKRDIEGTILAIESMVPGYRSSYLIGLVNTRLQETQTVIAQQRLASNNTSFAITEESLNNTLDTLQQAIDSTEKVSNPAQRKQLQQQITDQINTYQQKLSQSSIQLQQTVAPQPQKFQIDNKKTNSDTIATATTPTSTGNNQSNTTQTSPLALNTTIVTVNAINQAQNQIQNIASSIQPTPTPSQIEQPLLATLNALPSNAQKGTDGSWCVTVQPANYETLGTCEDGQTSGSNYLVYDKISNVCSSQYSDFVKLTQCGGKNYIDSSGKNQYKTYCLDPQTMGAQDNCGVFAGPNSTCSSGVCTAPSGQADDYTYKDSQGRLIAPKTNTWCYDTFKGAPFASPSYCEDGKIVNGQYIVTNNFNSSCMTMIGGDPGVLSANCYPSYYPEPSGENYAVASCGEDVHVPPGVEDNCTVYSFSQSTCVNGACTQK